MLSRPVSPTSNDLQSAGQSAEQSAGPRSVAERTPEGTPDHLERLRVAQRNGDLAAMNDALAAAAAGVHSNREASKSWRVALFSDAVDDEEIAALRLQAWRRRSLARVAARKAPEAEEAPPPAAEPAAKPGRAPTTGSIRLRHWQQPWWLSAGESGALLSGGLTNSQGLAEGAQPSPERPPPSPVCRSPVRLNTSPVQLSTTIALIHEEVRTGVRSFRQASEREHLPMIGARQAAAVLKRTASDARAAPAARDATTGTRAQQQRAAAARAAGRRPAAPLGRES